ncbi:Uncharacterised protein [Vibrio cholerae]|nr:Uncharacterised protein [Vibrio cholerae]CSD44969.1 Uncharacterised protein [Vibrio cholerae]
MAVIMPELRDVNLPQLNGGLFNCCSKSCLPTTKKRGRPSWGSSLNTSIPK